MDIYNLFRAGATANFHQEVFELEKISGHSIRQLKELFLKGYELNPPKKPATLTEVCYEFDISKIADHYGYESQSRQCVEEMAELTQAINKQWRCTRAGMDFSWTNIVQEIADVEMCLDQLKYFLCCRDEVENIKQEKVDRQLRRIEGTEVEVNV